MSLPIIPIEPDTDLWKRCEARLSISDTHEAIPDEITADERMIFMAGKPYHTFTFKGVIVATRKYVPTEEDIAEANAFIEEGLRRAGAEVVTGGDEG